MALRRSRRPASFNSLELIQRLLRVVGEIKTCCNDGSLDSGRMHGLAIRLRDGLRNIRRFSHLLGRQCHTNIVNGIEEMLHMLEQVMSYARENSGYTPPQYQGMLIIGIRPLSNV